MQPNCSPQTVYIFYADVFFSIHPLYGKTTVKIDVIQSALLVEIRLLCRSVAAH